MLWFGNTNRPGKWSQITDQEGLNPNKNKILKSVKVQPVMFENVQVMRNWRIDVKGSLAGTGWLSLHAFLKPFNQHNGGRNIGQ